MKNHMFEITGWSDPEWENQIVFILGSQISGMLHRWVNELMGNSSGVEAAETLKEATRVNQGTQTLTVVSKNSRDAKLWVHRNSNTINSERNRNKDQVNVITDCDSEQSKKYWVNHQES